MLIYLKFPGTARSQVAQGLPGQPQRDGQRGASLSSCDSGVLVRVTCITEPHDFNT